MTSKKNILLRMRIYYELFHPQWKSANDSCLDVDLFIDQIALVINQVPEGFQMRGREIERVVSIIQT